MAYYFLMLPHESPVQDSPPVTPPEADAISLDAGIADMRAGRVVEGRELFPGTVLRTDHFITQFKHLDAWWRDNCPRVHEFSDANSVVIIDLQTTPLSQPSFLRGGVVIRSWPLPTKHRVHYAVDEIRETVTLLAISGGPQAVLPPCNPIDAPGLAPTVADSR